MPSNKNQFSCQRIQKTQRQDAQWLQPNPVVSQRKIKYEMTTEISNNFWTKPILLFGKTDRLALSQTPNTMLSQQVLQYSTMGRSSNYVVGTYLPLIIL